MEGTQAEESMTVVSQITGAGLLLTLLLMNACAQPQRFGVLSKRLAGESPESMCNDYRDLLRI